MNKSIVILIILTLISGGFYLKKRSEKQRDEISTRISSKQLPFPKEILYIDGIEIEAFDGEPMDSYTDEDRRELEKILKLN